MKNPLIKRSLMILMLALTLADVVEASDNASISVSCSIPEVPGLNAPPYGQNISANYSTVEQKPASENSETEKNELGRPSKIQQESEEKIMLAGGRAESVITQTVYSR